jgi:hypothetical protein
MGLKEASNDSFPEPMAAITSPFGSSAIKSDPGVMLFKRFWSEARTKVSVAPLSPIGMVLEGMSVYAAEVIILLVAAFAQGIPRRQLSLRL